VEGAGLSSADMLIGFGIAVGLLGIFGLLWSTRASNKHASVTDRETQRNNTPVGVLLVIGAFAVMALFTLSLRRHDKTKTASLSVATLGVRDKSKGKPAWSTVHATFESNNATVGRWKLEAKACLSGPQRGVEGVVFTFANGSPVEEIRLDNARKGDNVVEVRLADRSGTVYRVRERECELFTSNIEVADLEFVGEILRRSTGSFAFSCPAHGLAGKATFDGCLP
jgi:hypothetical protein